MELVCKHINPIYFNFVNLFVSVAIVSDIMNKETNRIIQLFLLNYFIIILNNYHNVNCETFETENKTNHDLVRCTHIFFIISLWVAIGLSKGLGIKYYLLTFPFVLLFFYHNITENKTANKFSNYIIFLYYFILCYTSKK